MKDLQAIADGFEIEALRGGRYDPYRPDGGKFGDRIYDVRYVDTTSPPGLAPHGAGGSQ